MTQREFEVEVPGSLSPEAAEDAAVEAVADKLEADVLKSLGL